MIIMIFLIANNKTRTSTRTRTRAPQGFCVLEDELVERHARRVGCLLVVPEHNADHFRRVPLRDCFGLHRCEVAAVLD